MGNGQKVVVITGGSQGIGRAIALRFAQENANIFFCHYDPDDAEAEKTVSLVKEAGGQAQAFRVNVADKAQVKDFFKAVMDAAGQVDVLVNNAGITRDGFMVRMKEDAWDAVLSVNLKGVFLCIQEAGRIMMKQRQGRVINITSVVGVIGNAAQANYSAAKAGVIGLTKTAAKELASRGVLVNAVAPGFINTQMTAVLPEKAKDAFMAATPLGKMGEPEDIAAAVEFLASDGAAFITGQVLHVNGGLHM